MKMLKYHKWDDISINLYKEIVDVTSDEEMSDAEKEIAIIALLCEVEEEEVWNLPLGEIQSLRMDMQWIDKFDFNKKVKYKKIVIGNYKCKFHMDLSKMTYAQYVDFQAVWSSDKDNLAKLISCFFVPDGCKYGEGYDIADFINVINNNLSIVKANEICFFILTSLASSTKTFLKSWDLKMKWTMRLVKMPKGVKTQMGILRKSIQNIISMIG